ncbi:hypothetical protein PMIN03_006560 [Paraphaeosphaeria minitans]
MRLRSKHAIDPSIRDTMRPGTCVHSFSARDAVPTFGLKTFRLGSNPLTRSEQALSQSCPSTRKPCICQHSSVTLQHLPFLSREPMVPVCRAERLHLDSIFSWLGSSFT